MPGAWCPGHPFGVSLMPTLAQIELQRLNELNAKGGDEPISFDGDYHEAIVLHFDDDSLLIILKDTGDVFAR